MFADRCWRRPPRSNDKFHERKHPRPAQTGIIIETFKLLERQLLVFNSQKKNYKNFQQILVKNVRMIQKKLLKKEKRESVIIRLQEDVVEHL